MTRGLTDAEISELAAVFSDRIAASILLESIGLERGRQPGWATANANLFWHEVARMLGAGVVADGTSRLLAAAHTLFPYNAVFASGAGGDEPAVSQSRSPSQSGLPSADPPTGCFSLRGG